MSPGFSLVDSLMDTVHHSRLTRLTSFESISEAVFKEVILDVSRIWSRTPTEEIEVQAYWDSGGERDCAIRFPFTSLERPVIKITGSVPRTGLLSRDAFGLLVCHEFGHHLGGSPKLGSAHLIGWSSAEGQADYWSSLKCFRKVADLDLSLSSESYFALPEDVSDACEKAFLEKKDVQICKRSSAAALSLAGYFRSLGSTVEIGSRAPAAKSTLTRFRLDEFRDQCRVETFLAGAVCNPHGTQEFCEKGLGARPACWYRAE